MNNTYKKILFYKYFYILIFIFLISINCSRAGTEKKDEIPKIDIPKYCNGVAKINIPQTEGEDIQINKSFAGVINFITALAPGKRFFYGADASDKFRTVDKRKKEGEKYLEKKGTYKKNEGFELMKRFGVNKEIAKAWRSGNEPTEGRCNEITLRSMLGTLAAQIRFHKEVLKGKGGKKTFESLKELCGVNDKKDISIKDILNNILLTFKEKPNIKIIKKEEKSNKIDVIAHEHILNLENQNNIELTQRIKDKLKSGEQFYALPKQVKIFTKGKKEFEALTFKIKKEDINDSNFDHYYKLKYFTTKNGTFYIKLKDTEIIATGPGKSGETYTDKEIGEDIMKKALEEGEDLLLCYERYKV